MQKKSLQTSWGLVIKSGPLSYNAIFLMVFTIVLINNLILYYQDELRLSWSIENNFREVIKSPLSSNMILCSNSSLRDFEKMLGWYFRKMEKESICKFTHSSSNFSSVDHILYADCGQHKIISRFRWRSIPSNQMGCSTLKWSFDHEYSVLPMAFNQPLFGVVVCLFSSLYSLVIGQSGTFYYFSISNLCLFHILLFSSKGSPSISHKIACVQGSLTLISIVNQLKIRLFKTPNSFRILLYVLFFPFGMNLIVGTTAPSFSSIITSLRSSISLMFGDYVFPSFLEMKAAPCLCSYIGLVFIIMYIPICIFGLMYGANHIYGMTKNQWFRIKYY